MIEKIINSTNVKGGFKMKFNKKKLAMIGIPVLTFGVASALVAYFSMFAVTLDINQPVSIVYDGEVISGYDNIEEVISCNAGETCFGSLVGIHNEGVSVREFIISSTLNENVTVNYLDTSSQYIVDGIVSVPADDFVWFAIQYSPNKYLPSASQVEVITTIA